MDGCQNKGNRSRGWEELKYITPQSNIFQCFMDTYVYCNIQYRQKIKKRSKYECFSLLTRQMQNLAHLTVVLSLFCMFVCGSTKQSTMKSNVLQNKSIYIYIKRQPRISPAAYEKTHSVSLRKYFLLHFYTVIMFKLI